MCPHINIIFILKIESISIFYVKFKIILVVTLEFNSMFNYIYSKKMYYN
ncbi:protein of unknown function [Tepidibacter aestuarii]|nr:protein of unknown function [Tepidibacter aestuarii]